MIRNPPLSRYLDAVALDFDVKQLCFEGPMEQLSQTQYTQPCMVAVAIAITETLRSQGIQPDYALGLSLGEYSALYAAGVWGRRNYFGTGPFPRPGDGKKPCMAWIPKW